MKREGANNNKLSVCTNFAVYYHKYTVKQLHRYHGHFADKKSGTKGG